MQPVISVLTVTGKGDKRADGRLFCGFCNDTSEIHWYPKSPDQALEANVSRLHFERCRARGATSPVELTVFDGDTRQRLFVNIS